MTDLLKQQELVYIPPTQSCYYRDVQWISVEDRLPKTGVLVLAWGAHSEPWPCYRGISGWMDNCDDESVVGITHWMPLPDPPADEADA